MTVTATNDHAASAKQMLEELRAMLTSIPRFSHIPTAQRRRIITSAAVPNQFLLTMAQALDAVPALAAASELTSTDLRNAVTFSQEYLALVNEMAIGARGLKETVDVWRAEAGQAALRAYALAKGLNRPSDRDLLVPYLGELKRALGRGNRKQQPSPDDPVRASAKG
jgi:hypothetical protein